MYKSKALSSDAFPDTMLDFPVWKDKLTKYILEVMNGLRFPATNLRQGRLVLLSKSDSSTTSPSDTRPITILSPIWKIIEKVLLARYSKKLWD